MDMIHALFGVRDAFKGHRMAIQLLPNDFARLSDVASSSFSVASSSDARSDACAIGTINACASTKPPFGRHV